MSSNTSKFVDSKTKELACGSTMARDLAVP